MALFSSIMDFLANILVGAIHLSLIDSNKFVLVTYSIVCKSSFFPFWQLALFSVVDNKFVRDSVQFSNESTTFGQAFNDFSRSKKGILYKACCVFFLWEIFFFENLCNQICKFYVLYFL